MLSGHGSLTARSARSRSLLLGFTALLFVATRTPSSASNLPDLDLWRLADTDRFYEIDRVTGATRRLGNHTGFLDDRPRSGDAEAVARAFARENLALLGITERDLAEARLVDRVQSRLSGATHLYFRQRHGGVEVYNGGLQMHVAADGRIVSASCQFVPDLAAVASRAELGSLGVEDALAAVRVELGAVEIAREAVAPTHMWLPLSPGVVRRVWNFDVASADRSGWWNVNVDAADGRLLTVDSRHSHASYQVYETPVEHPGHTTPAPPADARTLALDPQDPLASPFGWHDTDGVAGAESTLTTGNNVDAYTDTNADNVPDPGSRPDGGAGLVFTTPLDLTQPPSANRPAAVANVFYWMNRTHDIEYHHGFDEVAGNFQVNNYGRGGLGGDPVLADVQDGSGTCGGTFAVAPDGTPGRLIAFICASATPAHDGAFDNFVQVHEMGHGIGRRIVGGPSTTSCLSNAENPGEGISDLYGLTLTATAEQTGPTPRPVGTWLFANLPNGIRPFPYSTDDAVNPHTFASTNTAAGSHGIGAVFAQIYWEVYWALVEAHGFDADLTNVTGTSADAGNLRAKSYLNEGLKLTPCNPGFVDVRDAIVAAATLLYDGADVCTVWGAFAAAGLGTDAQQGSANSTTDQVAGFAIPAACDNGIFSDGFESGGTGEWSLVIGGEP